MTRELAAVLSWLFGLTSFVVGVFLLVWFIRTLNRIQSNTRRTAEDTARLVWLAERAALALPTLPPLPPFRDDMTPAEVLGTIELRGGQLRVSDWWVTTREAVLDNPLVLDELGRHLFRRHNFTIAQLIVTRQVSGQ
jgi:hypothetical protein